MVRGEEIRVGGWVKREGEGGGGVLSLPIQLESHFNCVVDDGLTDGNPATSMNL